MSAIEWVFIVLCGSSLAIALLIAIVAAILGTDIPWLESQKERNPSYYEGSKMTLRYNGPMAAAVSILAATYCAYLFVARDRELFWIVAFVVSALLAWDSIRLTRWSWRQK